MSSTANADQAAAWDGDDGARWTEHEAHHNAAVRRHEERLFATAAVRPDDRVLDIGCGCGESTRHAARLTTSGSAVGVDLSARMLERAREQSRVEGLVNVSFEQADAQTHRFPADAFDLAISRTGAMFFDDPDAAFANIGRALRPGGRIALLAWQGIERNEWISALRGALAMGRSLPSPPISAPGPFGLADPDFVRRVLQGAGFGAVGFEDVREPFWVGSDAADAFGYIRTVGMTVGLLEGLDADDRARALENLRTLVTEHETADGVVFGSGAWVITAVH